MRACLMVGSSLLAGRQACRLLVTSCIVCRHDASNAACNPQVHVKNGGQRIATVIL
jgi:hypothetical protein